jgi:hypothetical protein
MVNPYSQKTVKKKGFDGVEYDVPQPRTFNSVLAGMAVSRAIQDQDYEAIATGPLSTRHSAQVALKEAGYEDKSATSGASTVTPATKSYVGTQTRGAILMSEQDPSAVDAKSLGGSGSSSGGGSSQPLGNVVTPEDEFLRRSGPLLLR